jgi:hypothetical protein
VRILIFLLFQSPVVDLSSSDDEKEIVDEKLDKKEAELKKIAGGMGKVSRGRINVTYK